MATIESLKIAFKPMTKMSLNERFQHLRQQTQLKRQNNANNKVIQNNNNTRLELRQGSQKNRRLALQMANRPSVLAALRAQNPVLNQRTGAPIKQRLGMKRFNNQTISQNQRNKNQIQNRFQNNLNKNVNRNRNLNKTRLQNRRLNNNMNNNTNNNIPVITGYRRTGLKNNRFIRTQAFKPNAIKTGFKPKRKLGQQNRNQNYPKIGVKKRFQINRNFNARNAGKQQNQQKRRNIKPNKEQLDMDLDAYMAGTKSHLDAELDAYMTQTV